MPSEVSFRAKDFLEATLARVKDLQEARNIIEEPSLLEPPVRHVELHKPKERTNKLLQNILVFDTETTGVGKSARMVQLAAMLANEEGEELSTMNMIIYPVGFEIPDQVVDIHGISTEYAKRVGLPLTMVLKTFSFMMFSADWFVAHNIDFDINILSNEFQIAGMSREADILRNPETSRQKRLCTMKETKDLVKAVNKRGAIKWPKLDELYHYCFGKHPESQHTALGDVRATASSVFYLIENEEINLWGGNECQK